ncbi:MAG: hypothetical protein J6U21_10450 [Bacteroidales bacterium]|nr:hypothetical protein [Bacteroidales bacterium]
MTNEEKAKKKREKKLKELYTRYNKCRDAELDRFWKNSVFVWVFLALCFTALGILIFDHYTQYKCQKLHRGLSEDDYYFLSLIISVFGFILSNIWVWMAQGLKAWYEVFETAIWQMETYDNVFEFPKEYTINNFWIIKDTNNSLQKFFVSSAPISTSRIVILIGRLLTLLWVCGFIIFLIKYSDPCCWDCDNYMNFFNYFLENPYCALKYCINYKLWGSVIIVTAIVFFGKILVQSSTLETDGEKECHRKIEEEINKIAKQKYDISITEEDAYRFICQNTYETIENKIKNCIVMVSQKKGMLLTSEIQNNIYNKVINKIEKLNDYGIVNEVDAELSSINKKSVFIKMSIVRYLCYRRFNIDIIQSDNNEPKLNLKKDFDCLKDKVISKYFTIKKVKKVNFNDNRIKVRCKAKHCIRDLFNCDIYNLHNIED